MGRLKSIIIGILLKIIAAVVLVSGVLLLAQLVGPAMHTVGLAVAIVALFWPKSQLGKYGFQVWVAFDKYGNAWLGGSHKETISSRLGKSLYYGHDPVFGFLFLDKLISFMLSAVDPDRCRKSVDWRVGSQENQPEETW